MGVSLGGRHRAVKAGWAPSSTPGADGANDNAMCESFFATLECELIDRSVVRTRAEAAAAAFEFKEGWHNQRGLQSSLGYVSPAHYERPLGRAVEDR